MIPGIQMKMSLENTVRVTKTQRFLYWFWTGRAARRGMGHFVGIALAIAASFTMFNIIYPAAKTMMTNSVNSMSQLNSNMLNQVNP